MSYSNLYLFRNRFDHCEHARVLDFSVLRYQQVIKESEKKLFEYLLNKHENENKKTLRKVVDNIKLVLAQKSKKERSEEMTKGNEEIGPEYLPECLSKNDGNDLARDADYFEGVGDSENAYYFRGYSITWWVE